MSDQPQLRPETLAIHAGQSPDPDDQRPGRPDLRHDVVRLRRRRPRRPALRPAGVREHLHPDHEPDARTSSRPAWPPSKAASGPSPSPPARRPRRRRSSTWPGPATTSSAAPSLYGGTYNLFQWTLPKLGITTRFVDGSDPASFAPAIDANTKAIYLETIGNPRLDVPDIAAIADVAHAHGIPLVIDNTFAPLLCRPDRARRRHRHPLGHEVDRRPRDVDRRRRRGRRHVRLEGLRPLPRLRGARSQLPRRQLRGGGRQPRLHHQAAGAGPARHGRGAQPVQRVPLPAGPRDAPAADRAPRAERPRRGPLARAGRAGHLGELPGPGVAPGARERDALPAGRLRRRAHLRHPRRPRGRAGRSSTA